MMVRQQRLVMTISLALSLYAQASRAELAHYYEIDRDSLDAPTTHDSGNKPALNGTRSSRLTLTVGRTGNHEDRALLFEGTRGDDLVYVDFPEYDFTDNFTISAWVRPNSLPPNMMMILSNAKGSMSRNSGFGFHLSTWLGDGGFGNLHLEAGDNTAAEEGRRNDAGTPPNIVELDGETWQHVAIAVDRAAGLAEMYYEGERLTSGVDTSIHREFNTIAPWRIGAFTGGLPLSFHGAMDEIAIWDETLTAEQIQNVVRFGARCYNRLGVDGDFDGDSVLSSVDIDRLMNEIAAETNQTPFDLNCDGAVNDGDRDDWLAQASTANGFAEPLLVGDSNLDGTVNANDLNALALNWRQDVHDWTAGNFTGGGVNAADLNGQALNWRQSVPAATSTSAPVPEPSASLLTIVTFALVCRRRKCRTD
jgi:hypothetical protein